MENWAEVFKSSKEKDPKLIGEELLKYYTIRMQMN